MQPDISIMTLDIIEAIKHKRSVTLNKKKSIKNLQVKPKSFYGDFIGFRALDISINKEIKIPFKDITHWSGLINY